MVRHISFFFTLLIAFLWLCGSSSFAADLLDRAFQPARDLQQIINIGIGKNAVGNEVFRGSTSTDGSLGITKACYTIIPSIDEDDCKTKKWNWEQKENTCYATPAIAGATELTCASMGGDWVAVTFVSLTKNAPLVVRVTRTLLRVTIAVAIPIIIYIGIQIILTGINGWSIMDKIKELLNVIIGLLLALFAIGIVFLIQAISLYSLVRTV